MTSFISSFLVEPVIRQARRFSRPSSDPEPDNPLTNSPHDPVGEKDIDAHAVEDDGLEVSSSDSQASRQTAIQFPQAYHVIASPIASPVSETTSFPEPSNAAQTQHRSSEPPVERSSTAGRNVSHREGDRWFSWPNDFSNPLHALPRYFHPGTRSTTNSVTSVDSEMTPAEGVNVFSSDDESRGRSTSNNSRMGDGVLPADDGMGKLRRRILEIQRSDVPTTEKSRLVHRLMTENYTPSQKGFYNPNATRLRSPDSAYSQERSSSPVSLRSYGESRTAVASSPESCVHETRFAKPTPEDLAPTYHVRPVNSKGSSNEGLEQSRRKSSDSEEGEKHLGCPHYRRNVKLQCSECFAWYTCRFCHDAVEDHSLIRRDTRRMLCMLCGTAQAASGECAACGVRSAWYYCDVCKLWNDDPQKSIYHCDDCGICRVGQGLGKDFFHCKVWRAEESNRTKIVTTGD